MLQMVSFYIVRAFYNGQICTYSRNKRMKSFEKIDLEGNNLMDNDLPKTFSTFNTFSDFDFSSMMRGQIMAQAVTQL